MSSELVNKSIERRAKKTRNHFGKAKLQSIKILKTKRRSKRRKPLNRRGERNGRATLRGVVSFAKMV